MADHDLLTDRPRSTARAWRVLRLYVTAGPPLCVWLIALAVDVAPAVLQAGFGVLAASWFAALAATLRHDRDDGGRPAPEVRDPSPPTSWQRRRPGTAACHGPSGTVRP